MADRVISYDFRGNFTNLTAGLTATSRSVQDLGSKMVALDRDGAQMRAGLDTIGRSAGRMGLVAAAGLGAVVYAAANFDKAMSHVAATGDDARKNLDALHDAAIKAGAATQYSATEAAQGMEALLKAGVSAKDVLGGALDGALSLAAAGELDVAQAAEIAATSMTQFGLAGGDVSHIADILAASASTAQGEVTDMAQALKYVGPVASQMGVSIEQTVGVITELAQQGVLADQAGTSLRGMLTSLTSPSKIAATTMSQLGINVYDAQGHFVGFDGVAGQLRDTMQNLTEAERNQYLGRIFGNEQITAARILYAGGAEAVDQNTEAINQNNFAVDVAAEKMNNLAGDVEKLKGSLETLFISSGEGAQSPLRAITQDATSAVNALNLLPASVKNTAVEALALTAVLGGGAWFTAKTINGIADMKQAFRGLNIEGASLRSGLVRVSLAGAAFGVAASGIADKVGLAHTATLGLAGSVAGPWGAAIGSGVGLALDFAQSIDHASDVTGKWNEQLKADSQSVSAYAGIVAEAQAHLSDLAGAVPDNQFDSILHSFDPRQIKLELQGIGQELGFGTLDSSALGQQSAAVQQVTRDYDDLVFAVNQVGRATGDLNWGEATRDVGELDMILLKAKPAMDALGISLQDLVAAGRDGSIVGLVDQIAGWVTHADSAKGRTEALAGAVGDLDQDFITTADSATALGKALDALLSPQIDLSAATDAWHAGLRHLKDDLDQNSHSLHGFSDAADKNREAIRSRVTDLQDMLVKEAEAGASSEELANHLKHQRGALLDAADAAGLSRKEVAHYIDTLGLTPKLVKTLIKQYGAEEATDKVTALQRYLDSLPTTKTIHINVTANTNAALAEIAAIGNGKGSADGGTVPKTGRAYADRHLYMLADGEEVISNRHGQADRHRGLLKAINAGFLASGGTAGSTYASTRTPFGLTARGDANFMHLDALVHAFGELLDGIHDLSDKELEIRRQDLDKTKKLLNDILEHRIKAAKDEADADKARLDAMVEANKALQESVKSTLTEDAFALPTRHAIGNGPNGDVELPSDFLQMSDDEKIAALNAAGATGYHLSSIATASQTLSENIRRIREAIRLYKELVKKGFDGDAFKELVANADVETLQAYNELTPRELQTIEHQYDIRQNLLNQAGHIVGQAANGDQIAGLREELRASREHLNDLVREGKETNRRLDRMERLTEKEPPKIGHEVAKALNKAVPK